jgi:hypothetical protein
MRSLRQEKHGSALAGGNKKAPTLPGASPAPARKPFFGADGTPQPAAKAPAPAPEPELEAAEEMEAEVEVAHPAPAPAPVPAAVQVRTPPAPGQSVASTAAASKPAPAAAAAPTPLPQPPLPTRADMFRQAGKKLRQDFVKNYMAQNGGAVSHDISRILRMFLGDYLPKRFGVGAGVLIDPLDKVTRQCEIVIYDSLACPLYLASERSAIYPTDYVAGVIEVKSVLSAHDLRAAFDKIAQVKALAKPGTFDPFSGRAVTRPPFGALFAYRSGISFEALIAEYTKIAREFGVGAHPDLIGVLDAGIIILHATRFGSEHWYPVFFGEADKKGSEGLHLSVGGLQLGEFALDGFFRFLLSQLVAPRSNSLVPSFDWLKTDVKLDLLLQYLVSFTDETDPTRRDETLARYRNDAMRSLGLK